MDLGLQTGTATAGHSFNLDQSVLVSSWPARRTQSHLIALDAESSWGEGAGFEEGEFR